MDDRDWCFAEACIKVALYIKEHGEITFEDVMRVSGSPYRRRAWLILRKIDRTMTVYREGTGRVLLDGE